MGIRDRILNKAKSVLGKTEEKKPSGLNAQGLPSALSADGFKAVVRKEGVKEGGAGTYQHPGGRVIAIFLKDGVYYCVDNECRHEDGPVGEGLITGCKVKCPYHDWEYDFTTGICTSWPENRLETYAVRERDGFLWVGPMLTKGTEMRGGAHNDGMSVITK